MSRCFPFPPPGYEKKDWAENINLLAKEKHKDKKHKKEKKEKEKKDHREKRDKDYSKDKHKEKKDRKEKQKDRKKDKNRYRGRTSEDIRAEERTENHNELHIQESWKKAEEGKDSKFSEELDRRTRDAGEANRMVGSFTSSIERKIGVGAASASPEKEKVDDKKVFPVHNNSGQRRNDGSGLPIDDVACSLQRTTGNTSPATSLEKERGKIHEKVTVGSGTVQSRNHRISLPMESSISGMVDRKTECFTAGMEKERFGHKNVVSYSIAPTFESGKLGTKIVASSSPATQRRNDILGLPVDNLSSIQCKAESMANSSAHTRMGDMGTVPAMEKKKRAKSSQIFPHPVSSEQKRNTSVFQPVEKDRYQKVERKDKNKVKKAEDRKGLEDRDQSEKKSKTKEEKHSKEKKKEEKIAKKDENIELDKLRNLGKKDQVDTLNTKLLAPHKDNTTGIIGVDGTTKKRKDLETNGFLHENDAWPNKIARMTSSSQFLVNGTTLELHISAPSSLPLKNGAMNNLMPDRILVNKESKINGTVKSQQLPVEVKPPAAGGLTENGEVTLKSPHPDSKYLSKIYTVPKMEEWPEVDDQYWLFNCCDSQQKLKTEPEAEDAPQVWAEALRIDSADAFALPYVVPF